MKIVAGRLLGLEDLNDVAMKEFRIFWNKVCYFISYYSVMTGDPDKADWKRITEVDEVR